MKGWAVSQAWHQWSVSLGCVSQVTLLRFWLSHLSCWGSVLLLQNDLEGFYHLWYPVATSLGEGSGTPLQYSCLENPMDAEAWWAAVHWVARSQIRQSDFTFTLPLLIPCSYLPRRRQWHPTPVLLPGKSHGRRSLVGWSPWGRWGSDTTERLHFHFSLSCIGEGNGNPLQCSCLENPRDGRAWWAAIYGVAQSRTRLKWLSS